MLGGCFNLKKPPGKDGGEKGEIIAVIFMNFTIEMG